MEGEQQANGKRTEICLVRYSGNGLKKVKESKLVIYIERDIEREI